MYRGLLMKRICLTSLLILLSLTTLSPTAAQQPSATPQPPLFIIKQHDPIKIAFTGDLTDQLASATLGMAHAAQLTAKTINDSGGIDNFNIEVDPTDHQCQPDQAVQIAKQIVSSNQDVAILGDNCPNAMLATLPVYEAALIPMVSASATSQAITAQGYHVANRVATNDAYQSTADADYMYDQLKVRTLATLDDGDAWGTAITKAVA